MAHKLQISRPVVFFDTETTGVNPQKDRVVQIAIIKLFPDGSEKEYETLVNPGIPIPKEASDVNHITDEMVKDAPSFKDISKELADWFRGSDLGGFNIVGFDIAILVEEFNRAGLTFTYDNKLLLDSFKIFVGRERRNLTAAVKLYLGEDFEEDAHDALNDTRASLRVLQAQMERYGIESLEELTKEVKGDSVDLQGKIKFKEGVPCFTFGKHKDKPVYEVWQMDQGYIHWIFKNEDITTDVKRHIRRIIDTAVKDAQAKRLETQRAESGVDELPY